nr:hypothetical protein [Pseudoalteromonas sp. WY3]
MIELLENISATEVDFLLHQVKPENQAEFKRSLWAFYIQNCPDTDVFLQAFSANQAELRQIELAAATEAPNWSIAIDLFNNRFVDMPFTLSLFNQADAALGKDKAKLSLRLKMVMIF